MDQIQLPNFFGNLNFFNLVVFALGSIFLLGNDTVHDVEITCIFLSLTTCIKLGMPNLLDVDE